LAVGSAVPASYVTTLRKAVHDNIASTVEIDRGPKSGPLHGSDNFAVVPQKDSSKSIHVAIMPPCRDLSGAECFFELHIKPRELPITLLTATLAAFFFFTFYSVVLHLTLGRFPILRGKKLHVNISVDKDERMSVVSSYEGISSIEKALLIPLEFLYYYPTNDGHKVEVIHCEVKSKHQLRLWPQFVPTPYYSGEIAFPEGVTGPVDVKVFYDVTRNFALNRNNLQARWDNPGEHDDFSWFSFAAWEELQIQFNWPAEFRWVDQGEDAPQAYRFQGEGARRESLGPTEWSAVGRQWTLNVRDAEPHQKFLFKWKLLPV
jgi:hypothetical protein